MKVTKNNLELMQSYIIRLLDYYSEFKNMHVSKKDIEGFTIGTKFQLWQQVCNNIKFDNSNLNVFYANEKRLFEQNENFSFYVDNTNDTTITTALNEVFKNIAKLYKTN